MRQILNRGSWFSPSKTGYILNTCMKKFCFAVLLLMFTLVLNAQISNQGTNAPIELRYFKVEKGSTHNKIFWLAPCVTEEASFEIQYSLNNKDFRTIESITASRLRCESPFEFADPFRSNSIHYYRLKMYNTTNHFLVNSYTVAVVNKGGGFENQCALTFYCTVERCAEYFIRRNRQGGNYSNRYQW